MSAPPSLRLSELNQMSPASFARALAGIYENSSWIPEAAATKAKPFNSLTALAKAMANVVQQADRSKQMALIREHPRLALKDPAAKAALTDNSRMEQTRTGLTNLNEAAQKQFALYSKQYEERHGFPFITCVLALDADAIVRQAGERVFNSTEEEVRRALREIERIAWLRLQRTVVDDSNHATPSTIAVESQPLGATRSSAGTHITDCQYGKSRVRVLKVMRDTPVHSVIEVDVQVLLRGALNSTFTRGDNSLVVPTDTCKNTVLVLSRQSLTDSTEEFALRIGSHFLAQYAHLSSVDVKLSERVWERMNVATEATPGVFNGPDAPHPHSFRLRGPETNKVHAVSTRSGSWLSSGIADLTVLKSTNSGFEHFPRDDGLTTLQSTDDRILATKIAAEWQWASIPAGGFRAANARLLQWFLVRFASRYSVSVQATEYEMALDALTAVPEIARISITLPNVHFLPFNLSPFKLPFEGKVFQPTDEPHGTIEVCVERDGHERSTHNTPQDIALGPFKGTKPTTPLLPRPRL
jgi:urate oxidase